MDGILLIDKPAGMTSFGVVAALRRLTGERKIGHAGTLDPMATGVLPLFLGRATKAVDLLPCRDKAYAASFRLGITTNTGDSTGRVTGRRPVSVGRAEAERAILALRGERLQIPPMVSAVRQNGRHLYELARRGETVERQPRPISVYEAALTGADEVAGEYEMAVRCSKGTYIRVLCEEIGESLGCGAAMTALRRTMAAGFPLSACLPLEDARALGEAGRLAERLLPLESAFSGCPAAVVSEKQAVRFQNGGELLLSRVSGLPDETFAGTCRVKTDAGVFIGLGRADPETGNLKILLNRV